MQPGIYMPNCLQTQSQLSSWMSTRQKVTACQPMPVHSTN